MGQPDPNFRPNPERSIYIAGRIDDAKVNSVAPQIMKLRNGESHNSPITVYINSNGGVTASADAIFGLLKTKDVDGNSPRIITVAIGNAKSAAADLLTYGDYAYAFQHASILFHGSRVGVPDNLTAEDSYSLGDSLGATNEAIALKLANASVQRLVIQYAILKSDFNKFRQENNKPNLSDIDCFANLLRGKIQSEWGKKAIKSAISKCARNDAITDFVFSRIKSKKGESEAEFDCKIINLILKYEVKDNKKRNWKLDEYGIGTVVEDYLLLRDYHIGGHTNKLNSLIGRFWRSFLSEQETKDYEQQQTKPKEELEKWLANLAGPRIRPFWYFAVSLWRALQTEDYALSASDAYRLGAIDEIIGLRRPCYRWVSEEGSAKGKTTSSTNEQPQPPSQSSPDSAPTKPPP